MKKKKMSSNRFSALEQSIADWKRGKVKFKASIPEKDGTRTTWSESGLDYQVRRKRLALFKSIRADLGLSQSEMASVLQVATKTLQGWEIGKPIPGPVMVLAELLHDFPNVRKRLLAA